MEILWISKNLLRQIRKITSSELFRRVKFLKKMWNWCNHSFAPKSLTNFNINFNQITWNGNMFFGKFVKSHQAKFFFGGFYSFRITVRCCPSANCTSICTAANNTELAKNFLFWKIREITLIKVFFGGF